jgi:hypothetical protein
MPVDLVVLCYIDSENQSGHAAAWSGLAIRRGLSASLNVVRLHNEALVRRRSLAVQPQLR